MKGVVMKRYPTVVDPEKGMTQKTQDFEAYKREVRTAIEKTLIKRDEQTDHYYDF
ncbi:MAG: hypothetical protein LBG52_09325 [Candidatus Peribacteria bacterium]|nr:hypothetical protein [Candidatus Peribacteria bacterium]